jgi:hypothetical protein
MRLREHQSESVHLSGEKFSLVLPGYVPRTVHLYPGHYTDNANPAVNLKGGVISYKSAELLPGCVLYPWAQIPP